MSAVIASPLPPPVPPVPLMTAEEFFTRYPNHHVELVRGVVRRIPMPGGEHGVVGATMSYLLSDHVRRNGLGRVMINDTYLITRRNPDEVRGMDVAFISYDRMPKGPMAKGPLEVAPELVVEVRSPLDTWVEVFTKVIEYLGAGVGVVVVLDPPPRTASAYRRAVLQEIFREGDTLTVPDVLPGLGIPVAGLFD